MAQISGPDHKLSPFVDEFIKQLEDDFAAPQQSRFQEYMPNCKKGVQEMEDSLSMNKSYAHKLIGSLKEMFRAGEAHATSMATCADDLVKFGTAMSTSEPTLGNSFVKFGTLLNQMSSLLSNLTSSSRNILFFSLNLLYENELKGSKYKSEIRALFGQYQSARNQVEREERKQIAALGLNPQDRVFTAEELASKLMADRRKFQMGACEYMLKYNDVTTKRGVDLAEHLVGYYQAQESYFKDGSTLLQALKGWEARFTQQVHELRAKQDDERKRLLAAKDSLREKLGIGAKVGYGHTQIDLQTNPDFTDKSGYLGKRPENFAAIRIPRRAWPKRYCTVSMNGFTLASSHTHNPTVKIPLMHFQFKDCPEPIDGRKYCLKLIAQTRTYTFDAESDKELSEWRQAMQNCQLKLFQGGEETSTLQRQRSAYGHLRVTTGQGTRELVKKIIAKIRSLPGNDRCCDCGAADPEWLSVNLGILTCINCSGRHRELSVQYSRIRSLTLDQIKTTELLIALVMGNGLLNEVLEANLTDPKPSPDTPLHKRQEFISSKYLQKKYIEPTVGKEALLQELYEAVDSRDIKQLLQVYAEGVDLCAPLPGLTRGETALHLAIEQEDLTSLHIVDFLLGNGHTENCVDQEGNTPLHLAVFCDNPQCMKLLLNHGAAVDAKNCDGQTPLDFAEEKSYDECAELLQDAGKKKFSKCEHIDVDWGVGEEEEDIYQTPVIDSVATTAAASPGGTGTIKKSDTTGDLANTDVPAKTPVKNSSATGVSESLRRRPMSTFVESPSRPRVLTHQSTENMLKGSTPLRQPFKFQHQNVYPAPKEAPPPPPRTVSTNAEVLQRATSGLPVPPKRKKRISMFPEQLESAAKIPADQQPTLFVVVAQYDCNPDHRDELGFSEGENLIVTKKLNKDWWRGYVEGNPSREGVFPVNYVQEITRQQPLN